VSRNISTKRFNLQSTYVAVGDLRLNCFACRIVHISCWPFDGSLCQSSIFQLIVIDHQHSFAIPLHEPAGHSQLFMWWLCVDAFRSIVCFPSADVTDVTSAEFPSFRCIQFV